MLWNELILASRFRMLRRNQGLSKRLAGGPIAEFHSADHRASGMGAVRGIAPAALLPNAVTAVSLLMDGRRSGCTAMRFT